MEKHRDSGVSLDLVFLDLEKAFDRLPRSLIMVAMREQRVPETYVRMIKDMFEGSKTKVRCLAGTSDDFNTSEGTNQGGVLSPVNFITALRKKKQ